MDAPGQLLQIGVDIHQIRDGTVEAVTDRPRCIGSFNARSCIPSDTIRCCAPSCRSRSNPRRAWSEAATMRERDAFNSARFSAL